MSENVFLAIAVSKPKSLDALPGAISAAKNLAAWANTQGYNTSLITDEEAAVTHERLRDELHTLLGDGGQNRVVISFAGHGLIRGGAEEFWLLNDWHSATGAVNHLKLRDRLITYRPKQIAFISDVCRSLVTSRAKHVDGNGVIDIQDYAEEPVQQVILNGTQKAQPSLHTPITEPEAYCFFSKVLVDILCGWKQDIEQTDISNDFLFDTLEVELPRLANRYNRRQIPDLQGSWRFPQNIWSQIKPELSSILTNNASPNPSEISPVYRNAANPTMMGSADYNSNSLERDFHTGIRNRNVYGSYISVEGVEIERVVFTSSLSYQPENSNTGKFLSRNADENVTSDSVLIELRDGSWLGGAVYSNMPSNFIVDNDGARSFTIGNDDSPNFGPLRLSAIASMGGVFNDPFELAANLRDMKHADPVLGVIASYAYARAGALEDIRRLAYFYSRHNQHLPFDIALLAKVQMIKTSSGFEAIIPAVQERAALNISERQRRFTTRATPEASIKVAGHFPWLRQGWALMEDDFRPEVKKLYRFSSGLRPSMFTTFRPDIGRNLMEYLLENNDG